MGGIGWGNVVHITMVITHFIHAGLGYVCPSGSHVILKIGMLMSKADTTFTANFLRSLREIPETPDCFLPTTVDFDVWKQFNMPSDGWTRVRGVLQASSIPRDSIDFHVVIGPYYMNIAMVLENLNITYIITAHKGFDWIDMNHVSDPVQWKTMIQLIPTTREQNKAVVDLFSYNKWEDAVMVMPDPAWYYQECQDLADQLIAAQVSLIPFSVPLRSEDTSITIQSMIRASQLSIQKRLIICSPRDKSDKFITSVLREAKEFQLLYKEDQVFIVIEPYSKLSALTGRSAYKLGLFGARAQILAFRFAPPNLDSDKKDLYEAVANDSSRVIGMAMQDFMVTTGAKRHNPTPQELLKHLKQIEVQGATGWIQFDENGERMNYSLGLYNHGGETLFNKVGEWRPEGQTFKDRLNVYPAKKALEPIRAGIFPAVVKVVVVLEPPFVSLREGATGNDRYQGFSIDILHKLSEELNFEYEIYISPDNRYGVRDGKNWDGMMKELLIGNATLAVGALAMTSERERFIDFSVGISSTGVNLLISKPQETSSIFQFILPFSAYTWLAIIGSWLGISLLYIVLDFGRHTKQFTGRESFWFSTGALMMRSTDFSPTPNSQRILTAGFCFFALITVSTYTANMAAFLTRKFMQDTVTSLEDLADSSAFMPLTVANTSITSRLRTSEKKSYMKLWHRLVETNGFVATANEAMEAINKNDNKVLIYDYDVTKYAESNFCQTMAVGFPVYTMDYAIGMPEASMFRLGLNLAILRLKEEGFMRAMKIKWWQNKRRCDTMTDTAQSSKRVQFDIIHMAGVFIVGGAGISFSVLLFLVKKFYLGAIVERCFSKGSKSTDEDNIENEDIDPQ